MTDGMTPLEHLNSAVGVEAKKQAILDDITKIVLEEVDVEPSDITYDASLVNDLTYDSLMVYELVVDLEEAYEVQLPDKVLDTLKTVADLVDLIYSLTA